MQMYEVTAMSEDMGTELRTKLFCAESEDDAIDQMTQLLEKENIPYGVCMAAEI